MQEISTTTVLYTVHVTPITRELFYNFNYYRTIQASFQNILAVDIPITDLRGDVGPKVIRNFTIFILTNRGINLHWL